jgi:hypothetical protein
LLAAIAPTPSLEDRLRSELAIFDTTMMIQAIRRLAGALGFEPPDDDRNATDPIDGDASITWHDAEWQ